MEELANSIAECPELTQIWHMYGQTDVRLSHSDIGPYVHVLCPAGFHVIGPSMVTCRKDGTWNDVTSPTCSASSMYGIPESDLILIGVLGGCGAIIILALTIVLARLVCFRSEAAHKSSLTRLHRSMDTLSTCHKYPYSVSQPMTPTLNGDPITIESARSTSHAGTLSSRGNLAEDEIMPYYISEQHPHLHTDYDSSHIDGRTANQHCNENNKFVSQRQQPYVSGHVTSVDDRPVFVNHAFSTDLNMDYAARWDNEVNASNAPYLPEYACVSRTTF